MERFELSRRLPDLPHFECGPFSHLGTSPDCFSIIATEIKKVNSFFGKKVDILFSRKKVRKRKEKELGKDLCAY